jgi:hypothetical protein
MRCLIPWSYSRAASTPTWSKTPSISRLMMPCMRVQASSPRSRTSGPSVRSWEARVPHCVSSRPASPGWPSARPTGLELPREAPQTALDRLAGVDASARHQQLRPTRSLLCRSRMKASEPIVRTHAIAGDDQQQRPTVLRRLLLRPRLRVRPRQRRHRSLGAARPPTWALGETPSFRPREGIRAEPACRPATRGLQGRSGSVRAVVAS